MKAKIVYLIMSLLSVPVFAQQYNITGVVKSNKDAEGISFATISILRADSSIVAGSVTNEVGKFSVNRINKGDYILRISHLGNKTYYSFLNVVGQIHLDDIFLSENEEMLHEIIIKAKRPFVQQRVDRYIVNVSDHLLTAGRSAIDVLRSTPGVLVQNKSISIMGEGVEVLIDGHPTHLSGNQLAQYLQSLQGENIDQIEVMTNASSKFDAEGSRGIINIKTKINKNIGVINGSVNIGDELSKKNKVVLGADLNYRKKEFNVYGSYNLRGGKDIQIIKDINTCSLDSEARTYNKMVDCDVYRTLSNNYRIGVDLFPSESNIIGFIFNGFYTNDASKLNSITTITPALVNTVYSQMDGVIVNDHSGNLYNANYKHLFDKKGTELSLDIDYAHIFNKQKQNQNYLFYTIDKTESEPRSSQQNSLPQINSVWSVKLDYQRPMLEKVFLETGLKVSSTKIDNDVYYNTLFNKVWINDENRSNYFKYKEIISAAYINYAQQFRKWAFQLGLRTEYCDSYGNQITTGQRNKKSYWDIFPSMFIQYTTSEKHNFGVSYSRRIKRPNYEMLNPFEIRLDNYSYWAGNPYLSPSYNSNIDFKYTYIQKLSATLSWTHNEKMIIIEPLVNFDDNRYGSVYENFGNRTAYIFMLNYNDSFFKCWQFNFMGQFAYIKNNSKKVVSNFDNDGLSGAIWCGNNLQFNKTLSAEVNMLLLPSIRTGYSKSDKLTNNLSLGIRKIILKNKGTITLSANDILSGQIVRNSVRYNDIYNKNYIDSNLRTFTISFSYKFGSDKVKSHRSHNIGIENEVERTHNSK